MIQVVTYQTSRDQRMDICPECAERLRAAGQWPRNSFGEEFCTVYRGLHASSWCDVHSNEEQAHIPAFARG
jgi:hypothetical protein